MKIPVTVHEETHKVPVTVHKATLSVDYIVRANMLVMELEKTLSDQQKALSATIDALGTYQDWLLKEIERIRDGL